MKNQLFSDIDNGKEFDNLELKILLENNNIKYIKKVLYIIGNRIYALSTHKDYKKIDLAEKKKISVLIYL